MESTNSRRYALYAIGEVLLVMIGILLALQVNNWNEWKRDRLTEYKVLRELVKTIEVNNQRSRGFMQSIDNLQTASDSLIYLIENDRIDVHITPLSYELAFRSGTNIYMSFAGYEELKNVGFDILQSDQIKSQIIELFDVVYQHDKEFINFMRANQPVYENYIVDNFHSFNEGLVPEDKAALFDDPKCLTLLRRIKWRRANITRHLDKAVSDGEKVLEMIRGELKEN